VRAAYIDLAEKNPQRICLVDASKELADVQQQVQQKLIEYNIIS
jgi:thymidylate kinase